MEKIVEKEETATARLFEIGCDVVAVCGRRSLRAWSAGYEIRLLDGRKMQSHSPQFRNVLEREYSQRHGATPTRGAVNMALGKLADCRFQNREKEIE